MKPSWKDAPEWAQWLVMDLDGSWWWHEDEPVSRGFEWFSSGKFEWAGSPHWEDAKERRP